MQNLYVDIPVMCDGIERRFNFTIIENNYGLHCILQAEGMQYRVDMELKPMWGDMPIDWVIAATQKLAEILKN